MSSPTILVDTDILSKLLRAEPMIVRKTQSYLQEHSCLTFSIITKYEILRGLKVKTATSQLQKFDLFCQANEVVPITEHIVELASEIYADLYRRGLLISDADILIAATAIHYNFILSTNNEDHFSRIQPLKIDNWNKQNV
ncbi:type II toxin-antitoxin system VapC family toxin [Myxococcota bacterium]|nr:type II toxin-antitoxin system VapC family toxin [Myxococcota bacterium]